ncbi:unnamed protein product [Blepharisma stoltei]|uniref:Uncharacterized protein n=1 Tax=Blepharisma stoltei TaxID=1481888 RepID=A0AAU9J709_9CILI|nr:unnamed protein product [Blepharisma stoltei]
MFGLSSLFEHFFISTEKALFKKELSPDRETIFVYRGGKVITINKKEGGTLFSKESIKFQDDIVKHIYNNFYVF